MCTFINLFFLQILQGDKNATSLCSKNISTLLQNKKKSITYKFPIKLDFNFTDTVPPGNKILKNSLH